MKGYVKPDVIVTNFEINEAVATCEASSSYDPVHVYCYIKAGDVDGVFYSGGCSYVASESNLVTIDGKQYLWWTGPTSGKPEAGYQDEEGYWHGDALMKKLNAAGISGQGIHAGPASTEVISIINSSV